MSAEDTYISAGGGVAYALLLRAGKDSLLQELTKLSPPIGHGEVAVTSAGNLPASYIFHAAALKIEKRAKYNVTSKSVKKAMKHVFAKAGPLGVTAIWVPLLGAGTAHLPPAVSFECILAAARRWKPALRSVVNTVIFREKELTRDHARDILEKTLGEKLLHC